MLTSSSKKVADCCLPTHPPTPPKQDPNRLLTVTYNQDMKSQELLEMTSKEMGLSAEQYLVSTPPPPVFPSPFSSLPG